MDGKTKTLLDICKNETFSMFDRMNLSKQIFKSNRMRYFLDIALDYMTASKPTEKKKIALMGFNIPEELIIACGAMPVWVLGGSTETASYSESFFARDVDPAVTSAVGMLAGKHLPRFQDVDLVIAPVYSDSMRKVSKILSKEYEVFVLDIPSIKEREACVKRWCAQMVDLANKICSITGKKLQKEDLINAAEIVAEAKGQIKEFVRLCNKYRNIFTVEWFFLILNTYYMTDDLEEWSRQLEALNHDMEDITHSEFMALRSLGINPRIALGGSSILFPNIKISTIFTEGQLEVAGIETEMYNHFLTTVTLKKKLFLKEMIEDLVIPYYEDDTSQAFTQNSARMKRLEELIKGGSVDALIYHVIRGQVAVDYEFEKIENYLMQNNIPVIRIETDYNYQDIEQLRIRIEAFGEMIRAKKRNEKAARRIG